MDAREKAEADLIEWARVRDERDERVRRALAAGVTKHRIYQLTGIARTTLDRLLSDQATT